MTYMDIGSKTKRAMWVIRPGALKYFREAAGLSLKELKRVSKTALSTIARLQAEPRAVVRGDTIHRLAKAVGCQASDLADLMSTAANAPGFIRAANGLVQAAPLALVELPTDAPRLSNLEDKAKPPPALGTLSKGAAWERGRGLARATVETAVGPVPILGFHQFKEAFSAPRSFDGQRFVVHGVPDDFSGSHAGAAEALQSDPGVCMRFRVVRSVGDQRATCPISFYSTVYTGSPTHAGQIKEALHSGATIALLTRLKYARKTFMLFEDPPRPRDLAFLVEEVLPVSSEMIAKPARPKARRNNRQKSREQAIILPEKSANNS